MAACSLAFDASHRRFGQAVGTIDMVGRLRRRMNFLYFRIESLLEMRRIVWAATKNIMRTPVMAQMEEVERTNIGNSLADEIRDVTKCIP
jgi:hypothetical protein